MPDDPIILQSRLARAHHRAEEAPAYSPDWDAAMALIEDLERRLAELAARTDTVRDEASRSTPVPGPSPALHGT